MANIHDLKTWYNSTSSAASLATNIGGNIATGKTRFLTYIRIERSEIASNGAISLSGTSFLVGSHAHSSVSFNDMTGVANFAIALAELEQSSLEKNANIPDNVLSIHFPGTPDMNSPICQVTGGSSSYMMLCRSNAGPQTRIFAQYYDAP